MIHRLTFLHTPCKIYTVPNKLILADNISLLWRTLQQRFPLWCPFSSLCMCQIWSITVTPMKLFSLQDYGCSHQPKQRQVLHLQRLHHHCLHMRESDLRSCFKANESVWNDAELWFCFLVGVAHVVVWVRDSCYFSILISRTPASALPCVSWDETRLVQQCSVVPKCLSAFFLIAMHTVWKHFNVLRWKEF